ncbi:MAG: protein phosphatase 2C domain-containing protein [Rhodospirillales bacterium]|nr:protein phosphatase 2C domain-containing protein [Rhodospirillales bacterium]
MAAWKVIGAAVRGPSHEQDGRPCQDAFAHHAGAERLIAVVADGAGSARFSDRGARLLGETVVSALAGHTETLEGLNGAVPESWQAAVAAAVERTRATLAAAIAEASPCDPPATLADFHATLVGAVAEPGCGFLFHIGDGSAAAVSDPGDWAGCTLSLPENGEFANETYFFTQDIWRDHLRFTAFGPSALIVLVSDGAMPFTLAERFAGLEGRFLGPVTAFLEEAAPEAGRAALAATLDRPDARRISSDDKTLLWARLLD